MGFIRGGAYSREHYGIEALRDSYTDFFRFNLPPKYQTLSHNQEYLKIEISTWLIWMDSSHLLDLTVHIFSKIIYFSIFLFCRAQTGTYQTFLLMIFQCLPGNTFTLKFLELLCLSILPKSRKIEHSLPLASFQLTHDAPQYVQHFPR